ncbi:hypothetical protein [Rhizobium tumorigenes]|uniref:hypothetical protein n=1 Tax=Rhizobium tumorigenes TaxID=2041385 RepID=UPI00241EB1DD|nr:hypothetical protein [Rhizobium tumorigenes]WFS00924.1 hypothetical protein PR016_17850 [Rhizobium tumorigenes]
MTGVTDMRPIEGIDGKTATASLWSSAWFVTLAYSLVVILVLLFLNRNAVDYIGADNDDAMRLVEVRDLLGGQGWFDMMQYRLGLGGGTLMHWSRFIDLPIASLIMLFRLFASPERAEVLAVTVWPLSLVLPFMASMALLGRRLGGLPGLHVTLVQTAFLIITSVRYLPGSIDHDNVQLGLVALIVAMLVDERFRASSFAIAALASALAIGIGAETTPFVAVACMVVATLWAWEGKVFAPAAAAFATTLTVAISAAFFATVPPHFYSMVTCDNLSLGFYGITAVGGVGLLLSALFASHLPRQTRFAVLVANGVAVAVAAVLLAPQCLGNPLGGLDPMLVELWLNSVSEAQSIVTLSVTEPTALGAFYAVGLLAIAVCVLRIVRHERPQLHTVLLALLAVNWIIALVQVRGAVFANLLAIPPLTLFVLDLRRVSNADSEDIRAAFFYVVGVLISVPAVWAVGGGLADSNVGNIFSKTPAIADVAADQSKCSSKDALAPLAALDPGVVVAASNLGSPILRFTRHRTLSGPYHRDADGMLAEMKIGLATPKDAQALMQQAGVTLLAYCAIDPQVEKLSQRSPDGLYAQIAKGNVPAYLEPFSVKQGPDIKFFRVRQP